MLNKLLFITVKLVVFRCTRRMWFLIHEKEGEGCPGLHGGLSKWALVPGRGGVQMGSSPRLLSNFNEQDVKAKSAVRNKKGKLVTVKYQILIYTP